MVTPLDMAKKFVIESDNVDQDLLFVYFLKGDEEEGKAIISTLDEFKDSINWSKFTFLN
jgi:hypothetical protein